MKSILPAIVITLFLFKYVGKEIKANTSKSLFNGNPVGSSQGNKDYLLNVDGKILKSQYLKVLTPRFITRFELLKSKDELKRYGEAGKGGVILVSLKKGTKWIKIDKIFNKNKIPRSLRTLKVVYREQIIEVDSLLTDKDTNYKVTVSRLSASPQGFLAFDGEFLLISETFD